MNALDLKKVSTSSTRWRRESESCKASVRDGGHKLTTIFKEEFSDHPLKESTVCAWKNKYEQEIKLRHKLGKLIDLKTLESARRGHPLLMGAVLDKEVQEYVKNLRDAGAVINSAIVRAVAEGIVKNHDSNLLQCSDGHIIVTKSWAKSFLDRMGYVKRRASTKLKSTLLIWKHKRISLCLMWKQLIVLMEEIPKAPVINWDHTGIQYMPVSSWTMAAEGSKRVEIAGINDKRQITAVFANTMSGDFLPPQIIYSGKTVRCLPSVTFPGNSHVTYTQNHWANEVTTEKYIKRIASSPVTMETVYRSWMFPNSGWHYSVSPTWGD